MIRQTNQSVMVDQNKIKVDDYREKNNKNKRKTNQSCTFTDIVANNDLPNFQLAIFFFILFLSPTLAFSNYWHKWVKYICSLIYPWTRKFNSSCGDRCLLNLASTSVLLVNAYNSSCMTNARLLNLDNGYVSWFNCCGLR